MTKIKTESLRTHLARRGWSQAELSRQTGVSDTVVSRAMKGESIAESSFRKILDALIAAPTNPLADELRDEAS